MRSPWLSREYEKSKNVIVKEEKDGYVLQNKKLGTEMKLNKSEYEKYDKNALNEIEWEKLFLRV